MYIPLYTHILLLLLSSDALDLAGAVLFTNSAGQDPGGNDIESAPALSSLVSGTRKKRDTTSIAVHLHVSNLAAEVHFDFEVGGESVGPISVGCVIIEVDTIACACFCLAPPFSSSSFCLRRLTLGKSLAHFIGLSSHRTCWTGTPTRVPVVMDFSRASRHTGS